MPQKDEKAKESKPQVSGEDKPKFSAEETEYNNRESVPFVDDDDKKNKAT